MTHRNILVIVLRLAAVFLAIRVLENFPQQFIGFLNLGDEYRTPSYLILAVIMPNAISLLLAALLWLFPDKLIATIIPDATKNKSDPEYFENLNSALISAVGVYIIAFGLADLIYFFALKKEMISQFGEGIVLQPTDHAAFVATLAEVVIGVLLIIGNKGVTQVIYKIRYKNV
ncbi:hypothetical protein [Aliikangiella maris]|uniref:Uncharacterized protein n=2 Tax=Aliikangiella maris TaxID=3162458 RepID=A0ABV2BSV5_9GAMM